jgi:hypothetical protein
MIRSKLLFFSSIMLLSFYGSLAQNMKGNVNMDDTHKPNASKGSLGADVINVDLYTGTASVNIPIYNYSVNGINLGVSLGYAAKGIRLDEAASSAGLGWNLIAGGSITRDANGLEDEITLPTHYQNDWADSIEGFLVPGAKRPSTGILPSDDDRERDMFHFNLPGRSFDVVFDIRNGDLVYQTYPLTEVSISITTEDINTSNQYVNVRNGVQRRIGPEKNKNVLCFLVVDERGNKYYYKRGDCQEKTFDFPYLGFHPSNAPFIPNTGTYYVTTKWDLTKIETYSGLEINYEYKTKNTDFVESVSETLYPRWEFDDSHAFSDPLQIKEERWIGTTSHIAKITYPDNKIVSFETDTTRWDKKRDFTLRNIVIGDKYDDNVKNDISYNFQFAYFNSIVGHMNCAKKEVPYYTYTAIANLLDPKSGINGDSAIQKHFELGLRLQLKGIRKIRSIGANFFEEPYYNFEYDTTYSMPYRFSAHKDHYGYYNGKTSIPYIRGSLTVNNKIDTFFLSIPYHANDANYYSDQIASPVYSTNWGLDRSYDLSYAKTFTINKIKNCGGGQTELQFQDYTLTNPSCSYGCIVYDQTGCRCDIDTFLEGEDDNDGLCIWKLINTDAFSSQNSSTTTYSFDYGNRFYRGGYYWYPDKLPPTPLLKIRTNYFVGANNYINGSNHGFGQATVITTGFASEQISKSIQTFTNLMYGGTSAIQRATGIAWHTMPAEIKKYALGLPLTADSYNEDNMKVSSTEYRYQYAAHWLNDMFNYKTFEGGFWKYLMIDFERMRLDTVIQKKFIYDPIAMSTTTGVDMQTRTYDNVDNIKTITTIDSKGDYFKKIFKYNYDYSTYYSVSDGLASMATGKQFRVSDETWKYSGSDSSLLSFNLVAPDSVNGRLRFPATFSTRILNPLLASSITTSVINKGSAFDYTNASTYGSNLVKDAEVLLYDDKNNPLETELENDRYVSAIWDYKTSKKIASVSNARYSDIAYTSFEGYNTYDSNPVTSRGNWSFDQEAVQYYADESLSKAMTGQYVYVMDPYAEEIESLPLTDQKYLLSFWAYTNEVPPVSVGNSSVTMVLQNTVGNWKLYTAVIQASNTDKIKIEHMPTPTQGPAPTYYIDEIRLHPINAFMASYTYVPMWGAGSVNDAGNRIIYYEYDELGRTITTKDMRGNVIQKKETGCNKDVSTDDPPVGNGGGEGGGSNG